MTDPLFDEPTVSEWLARTVGLSPEDFREVFGDGWQELHHQFHDYDADPSGEGFILGPWYVAGVPTQLMLRPRGDRLEIGVVSPRGRGSVVSVLPSRVVRLPVGPSLLETAPPVVADALQRRRSTFRWCRYCRSLTTPEERARPDVCAPCAGVVW